MSFQKPNFFIIGAPKCGTTSLANWLSEHPNIFICDIKEPHYFNTDGLRWIKNKSDYEKLFKKASNKHRAVGEASTHYIYSKAAIRNILAYSPDAKFIVCIRNPIEMAQSLYHERLYSGKEVASNFRKAWEMQETRKEGKKIPVPLKENPGRLYYGYLCCMGEKLNNLFKIVDRKIVKVVILEDLKKDPKKEYAELLKFLNVNLFEKEVFHVFNKSKQTRFQSINYILAIISRIKLKVGVTKPFGIRKLYNKIFTREKPKPKLDGQFKDELKNYFRDDVRLLSEILGRDLTSWVR